MRHVDDFGDLGDLFTLPPTLSLSLSLSLALSEEFTRDVVHLGGFVDCLTLPPTLSVRILRGTLKILEALLTGIPSFNTADTAWSIV